MRKAPNARTAVIAVLVLLAAGTALADWDPGDGHKMHFPQLPDLNGWDIECEDNILADDWQCAGTGPVEDVHIWVSWQGDNGDPDGIEAIRLSIHDNIPVGPSGWSVPGNLLWERVFGPGQFQARTWPEQGDQGFLYPGDPPDVLENDHRHFYQINIDPIEDPFIQQEGEIYWLDVQVIQAPMYADIGWKTSMDHFMDDAVYWDQQSGQWMELRDPLTGESLDMAFVITPEPASLGLLALGGLGLIRRRRKS